MLATKPEVQRGHATGHGQTLLCLLPRAVLDLATLAPRARKASQESLAPLALSHGTLTACHWSKSLAPLAPRAPQGRMGPLAGMASL